MVKPEKYFFLADGRILKNLRELALRLDEFSDELFRSHVNPDKNDFANWAEFVFEEKILAQKLRSTSDRQKFHIILLKDLLGRQKTKKIKKYKCDKCEKAFSSKVGLSVHSTIAHAKKG